MNLVPNHKCMSGLGIEPLPHVQGPGFLPQHNFPLKRREKIKYMQAFPDKAPNTQGCYEKPMRNPTPQLCPNSRQLSTKDK